ncbi:MAG: ATP-binding protein, partial [Thermoproteota archaeon]
MEKEKVLVSWSGGKDSSLALYEIQKNEGYEVASLFTTITKDYDRVTMHGVRRELLEEQARAIGVALHEVFIPKNASNEEYNKIMEREMKDAKEKGVSAVVFGDIFLEDVRKYREENLSKVSMKGIFPLWKRNSRKLVEDFI